MKKAVCAVLPPAVRLLPGHDHDGGPGVQIHRRTRRASVAGRPDEKFAVSDAQRAAGDPPRDWSKTLKELDLNLSFDLHIEPISKFKLSENSMQHLRAGDIVALDDQYTFIQRIPRSHYVLSVGPVPYLYFCMRCACSIWP